MSSHRSTVVHPMTRTQIHDIKNRLTVVKGIAQLLDRQARRDDWHRDKMVSRIDQLQVEIRALEQVIEDSMTADSTVPDPSMDTLH